MIYSEKILSFIKLSSTQAYLQAGSTIKVGARFFTLSSNLVIDKTIVGLGGMESAVAASTFYYVYAVHSAGNIYLIASTSAVAPSAYPVNRKIGAFYTDTSANIFKAYSFGEFVKTFYNAAVSNTGVVSGGSDWINGNMTVGSAIFTGTLVSGLVSLPMRLFGTVDGDNHIVQASMGGVQTTTTINYRTQRTDNVAVATNAFITCQKQGVDAIQPDWKLY